MKPRRKKLMTSAVIVSILLLTLSGCSTNSEIDDTKTSALSVEERVQGTEVSETGNQTVTEYIPVSYQYSKEETNCDWENANAVKIHLSNQGIICDASSNTVSVSENVVTIYAGGVYVFDGSINDGQIIVNSVDQNIITIVLNGVDITSSNSAPIYIQEAEKTILSLADQTENILTDSSEYVLVNDDEPNATIFSKDDLVIQGPGSLEVNANYNNGITSKDKLIITGGNISVTSVDDGIIGKDLLAIQGGNITLNVDGDGLRATNTKDTTLGNILIDGGTIDITSNGDAIQAENQTIINGGTFSIITGGGSVNGSAHSESWGNWGGSFTETDSQETTTSAKAIKATNYISITNGTFYIDSSDDSIHSNDVVEILEGSFQIASGDDGVHADTKLSIHGGDIDITKSYEGIESTEIDIYGGNISVVASDDGINASGGNDSSAISGRPGQNMFSSTGNGLIYFYGGKVVVDAAGDGIDANGSIYQSGGTIIVNGPTDNGNGAFDYDQVCEVTGGLLIAAGSSGMAQAPSTGSTQNSIQVTTDAIQEAGTLISVTDLQGTVIIAFEPTKIYQTVVVSSPEFVTGNEYTVNVGGEVVGNEENGLYTDIASCEHYEVLDTVTLDSVITYVGTASSVGGAFGGGMHGDMGGKRKN